MGNKQIRTGQLIAPFGPGSIYTDRRGVPHIVAGLDHWFMQWDQVKGKMVSCSDPEDFVKNELRLSALLRVSHFRLPPDYRFFRKTNPTAQPPPNANLFVPALRFPRWYRQTRTGEMQRFNLDAAQLPRTQAGGGRWQPVRFISVCAAGHLGEFPWKRWINCQCLGESNFVLTDRGGSELSSIRIECRSCPPGSPGRRGRSLAGTTIKPNVELGEQSEFQKAGIPCHGECPWLGEEAKEHSCVQPLIAGLINQTNIYFPRTISAIALPDLRSQDPAVTTLRNQINALPSLGVARTIWNMKNRPATVAMIRADLDALEVSCDPVQIQEALESLFDEKPAQMPTGTAQPNAPESEFLAFRRAEFNIIRNQLNDPQKIPDLRVIPAQVPPDLSPWFARVNLVERLRETRVFYGFNRLDQNNNNNVLQQMPDIAMRQLFYTPPQNPQDRWLPAVEVFGEGIFVELREQSLVDWQTARADWLSSRLDDRFINRLEGVFQTMPPLGVATRQWASRYLLVHSLAHILINQLVFECGYSTASLRERLYVSQDSNAPMASFMVYTAAGDADGTLGGLVSLGRPERLEAVVRRSLSRASWCSADPVCSEHLGGQGSKLSNLAACHACILLPETSCETINQGLDRAMVVGTPDARENGFMSKLLEENYTLE
ncbi:MAG: DUF1998 domain-containing protein [Verrucomicrobia bacterium]|nr:DUF1998 domain-containing protein [Verrucomicrobiota bacterium]